MWNTLGVLSVLAETYPLYMTDLERDSILSRPEAAEAIRAGSASEGSSTGFLYVDQLGWEPGAGEATLRLGAKQAEVLAKLLQGRLPHGRSLSLISAECRVILEPGDAAAIRELEGGVCLTLHPEAVDELSARLEPVAGMLRLASWPGVALEIVQTHIKDSDGNVVQTIG